MNLFFDKIKYRNGFTPTPTFTKSCSIPSLFIFGDKICSTNFSKRKLVKGFTLVELMVAVALFSTAVVVGVGALYSAQQINIKLQATHIIMDGMNLSLEVMTRGMRYGSNFYCGTGASDITNVSRKNCLYINNDNTSGGGSIVFRPVSAVDINDRIAYYVNNNHLMEATSNNGVITGTPKQISSDDIIIENLRFYVVGSNKSTPNVNDLDGGDTNQPMVTLTISGKTKISKQAQEVKFVLQSSVTTRNTD